MPSIAEFAVADIFSSLMTLGLFASASTATYEEDSEFYRGWLLIGGGNSDYSESD